MKSILVCLFAILAVPSQSVSADAGPEAGFQAALRLLQEEKNDEAAQLFEKEYVAGKDFPALFYNWGHAAYRLQKKGFASALWRRALYLDPELSVASQALDFVSKELPRDASAENLSTWASFRLNVLERVSLNKLLTATWIFLATAGFLLIRYWGARVRALREETPLPRVPSVGLIFASITLFLIFTSIAKGFTHLENRATVIAGNTTLRTGPSAEDNSIFEIIEGVDVAIRQVQPMVAPDGAKLPGWALITLNSGTSGWVPTQALFQHAGREHLW